MGRRKLIQRRGIAVRPIPLTGALLALTLLHACGSAPTEPEKVPEVEPVALPENICDLVRESGRDWYVHLPEKEHITTSGANASRASCRLSGSASSTTLSGESFESHRDIIVEINTYAGDIDAAKTALSSSISKRCSQFEQAANAKYDEIPGGGGCSSDSVNADGSSAGRASGVTRVSGAYGLISVEVDATKDGNHDLAAPERSLLIGGLSSELTELASK